MPVKHHDMGLRRLNPYLDAMDFSSLETFAGK